MPLLCRPGTEALKHVIEKTVPGPNGDIPVRIFVPEAVSLYLLLLKERFLNHYTERA